MENDGEQVELFELGNGILPDEPRKETYHQPKLDISKIKSNMDTVNPLLKPACDELKGQLRRLRERLSNENREGNATLQATKKKRTELGELLSQLQDTRTHQQQRTTKLECELDGIQKLENEASKALGMLEEEGEAEAALTALKRAKIESLQLELSKLTDKLHYLEGVNEHETSELAATQRLNWLHQERAEQQLLQNRKRDAIIHQLRENIDLTKAISASDRGAAELHSKEEQAKAAKVTALEENVAAVKKEAKLLHSRWENALIKLRKVDVEIAEVVSKRQGTEEKIVVVNREAATLKKQQSIESEHNWRRGHAVNQALLRSKDAENRRLKAEEDLNHVLEVQKITAAEAAEVVIKLQQQETAKKEAERHMDELLMQKHRVEAAYNSLELKYSSLLEARCEAESSLQFTKQELRAAKQLTAEKIAQIAELETEILKLQTDIQAKKTTLETLHTDIEDAEREVRACVAHLEGLQQQTKVILKAIEQRTGQLQALDKRKQEREEARKDDNGANTLCVEIKRLRKELAATEEGRRTAQDGWSHAQQRLCSNSQRYFQLMDLVADAEKKLEENIKTRNDALHAIKSSEMEISCLNKKLESLQKEISLLDVGLDDMSKLETQVDDDLTFQQTQYAAKLQILEESCVRKEQEIVEALKLHTKAAADTSAADLLSQQITARKKAQTIQIKENRKLLKGENEEATALQGKAAVLLRKLSAVSKRRNTAMMLLQKATVASGIDSSDRYVLKHRKSSGSTIAEIEAAKQRLEALRLEKKNENMATSGSGSSVHLM